MMTTSTVLPADHRRIPFRDGLAAEALRGIVVASRYVKGVAMRVNASSVALRGTPDTGAAYVSELVHGEVIDVYERKAGWAWGQAKRDGYVGFLPEDALTQTGSERTHRVVALRSFLYPFPSIKATPIGYLPYGAEVRIEGVKGEFSNIGNSFVYSNHLSLSSEYAAEPVCEAERFSGTPYLWGGKSSLGFDCSGLVQSVCFSCGILAPRDSDMQEAELGSVLEIPSDPACLPRGALLFWPGHVAISQGAGRMIHANAHHMMVVSEAIAPALARIEAGGNRLRSARLLPGFSD